MPTFTLNGKEVSSLPDVEQKVQLAPETEKAVRDYINRVKGDPEYRAWVSKDEKVRLDAMMEPDLSHQTESIGAAVAEQRGSTPVIEAQSVGTLDDILSEYGGEDLIIHPCEIAGKLWGIRELDTYTLLDLETRRLTVERGQIVRKPDKEVKLGLAMELLTTVYRKEGAKWEPFFENMKEVEKFLRTPKVRGLVNELCEAIYEKNESLDPIAKIRAAQGA